MIVIMYWLGSDSRVIYLTQVIATKKTKTNYSCIATLEFIVWFYKVVKGL